MVDVFSEDLRIQPSEFFNLPFFESLMLLDIHQKRVERQNKETSQQTKSQEKEFSKMQQNFNMNAMQNQFKIPEFKMPDIPKPTF